jgi:small subunit ribosomal protein S21
MIEVKVRNGEPVDRALKRLKKKLKDEAVLDSVRQRRYFTPKSEKRKKSKQNAYYKELMRTWVTFNS